MEQERFLEEYLIFPAPQELCNPPSLIGAGSNPTSNQIQPRPEEQPEFVANWTSNQTKLLLDIYKKYRPKVGTFEIKNLKKLWEVTAKKINEILKTNYSSSHVENRWRVVERSYKKFIDGQKKTGGGKKYFEYQEEMDDIFKGKKNVKPDVLLSADTVEHLVEEAEPMPSTSSTQVHTPKKSFSLRRRNNPMVSKNLTMEQIRKDRKEYNRERIEVEKEKLELDKQKIILMKERNELLRERNELLKHKVCSACSRDAI